MKLRMVNVDAWPSVDLLSSWSKRIPLSMPTMRIGIQSGALRTQQSGQCHLIHKSDLLAWLGVDPDARGQGILLSDRPTTYRRRIVGSRRQAKPKAAS